MAVPPLPPEPPAVTVLRVRDLSLEPAAGVQGEASWTQFHETIELRLPLRGRAWENLADANAIRVEVAPRDVDVSLEPATTAAMAAADVEACRGALRAAGGRLMQEVEPSRCWFDVAWEPCDVEGTCARTLVLGLWKASPGRAWRGVFEQQLFRRQYFGWGPQASAGGVGAAADAGDRPGGQRPRRIPPGRPRDLDDPYVAGRSQLCSELEQGQSADAVHFRLILREKKLQEVLERVPHNRLWGLDIADRYLKLFVRGDESEPVLLGELAGACEPHGSRLELSELTREVPGHRIVGTTETLPCLLLTLRKARGSAPWSEPLLDGGDMELADTVGSLEDFVARLQREPSPDRDEWTPDEWADDLKLKGDAAFKAGSFKDASVYYSRALRHTPMNEKLLSNRSAAYLRDGKWQAALDDALSAEALEPDWAKVHFRKGQALRGLRRFADALEAFRHGRVLDVGCADLSAWDFEIRRTEEAQARRTSRASK
eukprot:TRINITY_DN39683_c0_g1_i1.p1 TRINITY_DN39683_c0_g1~~TRINITY_DN39683_c0_g1_i1.p1  ORF type:complete len:502 (+),score=119.54 TRINITY_DN39683_c0_g1_i1:48-1508(+)